MKRKWTPTILLIAELLTFMAALANSARDKYTVKVPNGLSFSEFRRIRGLACEGRVWGGNLSWGRVAARPQAQFARGRTQGWPRIAM